MKFLRATRQVFIRIQGVQHYLWRAVDQDGVVLDILVQRRRDAGAAKRFFRRLAASVGQNSPFPRRLRVRFMQQRSL